MKFFELVGKLVDLSLYGGEIFVQSELPGRWGCACGLRILGVVVDAALALSAQVRFKRVVVVRVPVFVPQGVVPLGGRGRRWWWLLPVARWCRSKTRRSKVDGGGKSFVEAPTAKKRLELGSVVFVGAVVHPHATGVVL